MGVRLIHEDDEVIVVDKPPGLVTAPGPDSPRGKDSDASVMTVIRRHIRSNKRRNARAWVVHRLDKDASGLLVFAKTQKAFDWLKEDFRARRVHRLYIAVCEGVFSPEAQQGTFQSFLAQDERGLMHSVGTPGSRPPVGMGEEVQLAVTHYKVIASGRGVSVLQVRLQTGRKNQIRVHLSEADHSLIGDYRYRGKLAVDQVRDPMRRVCLHATELGFTHSATGKALRFTSPAPPTFWRLAGAHPPENTLGSFAEPETNNTTVPHAPSNVTSLESSWDHVAGWYEQLLEKEGSDHYKDLIVPGTLRLLNPSVGQRVLDIACGEGLICRRLQALGVEAVGIDASPKLIEAARRASPPEVRPVPRFEICDARALGSLKLPSFDAATCVMALMNIDPLEAVFAGCAKHLKAGGVLIGVILHPAFRAPGQTSWGWDEGAKPQESGRDRRNTNDPRSRATRPGPPSRVEGGRSESPKQYRRVDGYLSAGQKPIVMNPGKVAHGGNAITTWTFHRPIQAYVRALADSGFLLEALEEWPSRRRSQPGPKAEEENRARREIPLILGFRAIKRG